MMCAIFAAIFLCVFLKPADGKFIVHKVEDCEPIDYLQKYDIKLYFENKLQYADSNATFKVPLSNDLKVMFRIDLVRGKHQMQIMSATERNACNVVHRYLGEFAYGIERAASLTPGLCPIPKGKYRVSHHLIDLDKMTIRGLPQGMLHFKVTIMEKSDAIVNCMIGDVENI